MSTGGVTGNPSDQAGDDRQGSGSGLAAAIESAFTDLGLDDEGEAPAETPASKTAKKEPIAEEQPPAEAAETDDKPGTEETPPPAPASKVTAPAQWDAANRAKFDGLPDAAKSIVLDLAKHQEADYTRKMKGLAVERQFAQSVLELITDEHREQLEAAGLDEVQGIARLLEYQDFALRQPRNYLRWFAQAANLRPADIFPEAFAAGGRPAPTNGQTPPGQAPARQPTNGAVDPHVAQLRGAVEHIQGWINEEHKRRQTEAREQNASVQRQALSVIDRFRSSKDDKGEPVYPHFARVEDDMTEILKIKFRDVEDPMERLRLAYDAAVSYDPELREQRVNLEAARKAADERKKADVEKARAAKQPVPSVVPPTGEAGRGKRSLNDFVSEAMSEHGVS